MQWYVKKMKKLSFFLLFLPFVSSPLLVVQEDILLAASEDLKALEVLRIAIVPEKNIFEQRKRYAHITNYLSRKLSLNIHVEFLSDYSEILESFENNKIDAGFIGSFSYILTHIKTDILPIARPVWLDNNSTYSGYIFVHKNSGIKSKEDMKGKKLVLVHKATTAGYLFQMSYFKKQGVANVNDFFSKVLFAGSHDTAAWAVYIGEADVGGCKNHVFNELGNKYPDFKDKLTILAESSHVPSNGLVVKKNIPLKLRESLKNTLINLHKTEEGRQVLKHFGAKKFIETRDEDYKPLYQMIEELHIDLKSFIRTL